MYLKLFEAETVEVSVAEVDETMVVVPELETVADSRVVVFCSALVPMNSEFAVDALEAVVPMLVVVVTGEALRAKDSVAAAFVLEAERLVEPDESMEAVFELDSETESMYLQVVVTGFAVGSERPNLIEAVAGSEVESKGIGDAVERLSKMVLVEILVAVGPRLAVLGADFDLGTKY